MTDERLSAVARFVALTFWYGVLAIQGVPRLVRLYRHTLIPDDAMLAAAMDAALLDDETTP